MIFIIGDTHGEIDIKKLNSDSFPQQKTMSKSDFVIIVGDFGVIWDDSNTQKYWLKWLEEKRFTTLFIDGNHENFNLLYRYPIESWCGGKVHRISSSILHLMRGQVFEIDGYKLLTFGGAKSVDKRFRTEGVSWWEQEMPSHEEYNEGLENLKRNDNKVDFVVTHTAPSQILRVLAGKETDHLEDDDLTIYLENIRQLVTFKTWYFGHFHQDQDIFDGKFKLVYNRFHLVC